MLFHGINIIVFTHSEKIFTGITVVLSSYLAAFLKSFLNSEDSKKIIKQQLIFTFVFYVIMLIDFTLIDDTLGRNILNVFSWDKNAFREYINTSTNLVPFKTVNLFINGYKSGALTLFSMLENIFGNIIAFMPIPFFIICLFKSFNNAFRVFITVLTTVLSIELLQFLFLTGSADIDDVLLNVSGAMLIYGILKIKAVSRIISKLTYGVWKTIEN